MIFLGLSRECLWATNSTVDLVDWKYLDFGKISLHGYLIVIPVDNGQYLVVSVNPIISMAEREAKKVCI